MMFVEYIQTSHGLVSAMLSTLPEMWTESGPVPQACNILTYMRGWDKRARSLRPAWAMEWAQGKYDLGRSYLKVKQHERWLDLSQCIFLNIWETRYNSQGLKISKQTEKNLLSFFFSFEKHFFTTATISSAKAQCV